MNIVLLLVILILAALLLDARSRLARSRPCVRCGETGSTEPFQGSDDSYPRFFREPILLCVSCRHAQDSFLRHRFMLETEGRFHFGRADLARYAETEWGTQALDVLAALISAKEDMDSLRRVMTQDSYERVRPWIEAALSSTNSEQPMVARRAVLRAREAELLAKCERGDASPADKHDLVGVVLERVAIGDA